MKRFFFFAAFSLAAHSVLALDAPHVIQPNDNHVFDLNSQATFAWHGVSDANRYQLVIAADSDFSSFDEHQNRCTDKKRCVALTLRQHAYKLAKSHRFMKTQGSYFWKIRSYQGDTASAFSQTYAFNVSSAETFSMGEHHFSFTKIANDGTALPKTAPGTAPKDWACVRDNNTGLVWQIETQSQPLPFLASDSLESAEVDASNDKGRCGITDWQRPSDDELSSLIYCQNGQRKHFANGESIFVCQQKTARASSYYYYPNKRAVSSGYGNVACYVYFGLGYVKTSKNPSAYVSYCLRIMRGVR